LKEKEKEEEKKDEVIVGNNTFNFDGLFNENWRWNIFFVNFVGK
jgi:hypothetical protein